VRKISPPTGFPSSFWQLYGERRFVYRVLVMDMFRERKHLEDPGVDGIIVLKWN